MKCEICGIDRGSYNGVCYSGVLSDERNFQQEFRGKKGLKQKDNNDEFEFCQKCDKEFRKFYAETLIEELSQKNFSEVGIYSFCGRESFDSEDNWQKFKKALTKNIQCHYREWKIIKATLSGNEQPQEYLVNQSARMEYENGLLKFEPKKIHLIYQLPLDWEKWRNVQEQIIMNSQPEKNNFLPNQADFNFYWWAGFLISFFFIIGLFFIFQRKKIKN